MKKGLLGAVAVAAVMVGPAVAADLRRPVTKAPPPGYAYNWTGFYAGGHCGDAWGRTTTRNTAPYNGFDNLGDPISYSLNDSGWTCGGQLGFNWQVGAWVVGVEGDIGWLDIDRSSFFFPTPVGGLDADFVSVSYSWYATATARIGYAWDRVLLYAKGGAAWARIENAAADANTSFAIDTSDFRSDRRTHTGWTIGGGLEYGLTPNVSLKVEYLYLDFGRYTSGLNLDGDSFSHDNRVHTVKGGFNIRFGGPVVAKN
jgi:outer membrane immunogenic protein